MTKTTLITGGDGFFGNLFAKKVLNHTNNNIALWMRANNDTELQEKREILEARFAHHKGRVELHFGNLSDTYPLRSVPTQHISEIIHTAAITRFNVEEELANSINREGSRKVMDFARRCGVLDQFSYISTVYSSGLKEGLVEENYVDPTRQFCNFYEKSKCEAEHFLHSEYRDLPWTIFRPATMIADDNSGRVSQYNVFHNTMRLLFYGLISLIPGHKDTPIYLTTGSYTGDAIFYISHANKSIENKHKIYNICHNKNEALSLGKLIDRIFLNFEKDNAFTKRRILKPLFTDMQAFDSLAASLKGLGGAVVREALESIRPFSKQLFITKDIRTDNLLADWPEHKFTDINVLTDNVARHLIASSWGNKP